MTYKKDDFTGLCAIEAPPAWACTLPKGHAGPHKVQAWNKDTGKFDGRVVKVWERIVK